MPQQKVIRPKTQATFDAGKGTSLEVKNDTKTKGEYDVTSAGSTPPDNRNTYIFPNTSEKWTLINNNNAVVNNVGNTTLIVTRY